VQLLLAVVAIAALAWLGFLSHAPNRLLSGRPIGFLQAAELAGRLPVASLAGSTILLVAPLVWPRSGSVHWISLIGAGGVAGAATWLAGSAAVSLAAGAGPSARTSLGGGYWLVLAAALLMAGDAAGRLRLTPLMASLAGVLVVSPVAALIATGMLSQLSLLREYAVQRELFADALIRHMAIVAAALVPTVLAGVPLGVLAWRRRQLRRLVFPALNIVQTIPSIALFGLLMAPLSGLAALFPILANIGISGVGIAPAVIALVLYSLLPVVRNTVEGLDGVPAPVRDAARGMGMSPRQMFWWVDVPLALPVVLSGVRITAVQAVGLAAVSALIGAGGLGAIMFQGLFANALDLVLLGALPVILLAVVIDMIFRVLGALTVRGQA
jgi:osmoprotectant transport system permease protein